MTFEKEFPSFKFGETYGRVDMHEPREMVTRLVHLQDFCLDKQRVREAIKKIATDNNLNNTPQLAKTDEQKGIYRALLDLMKELGL